MIDPALQASIEQYLLDRGDWVPVKELSARFSIRARAFRALDYQPGLCSTCAISSDKGLKHIRCATTAEWRRFRLRMERHAKGELHRLSGLKATRAAMVISRRRPPLTERDSPQTLMPIIGTP